MIMFVGQVAREMREREAFQELDYRAVFGTMVKWATEIDDPARIPEIVSRAFYTACNGRPGPVVVALPEDMLVERVAVPDAPAFEPVETWPGLADMAKLQKLLWAAKSPIVLAGTVRLIEFLLTVLVGSAIYGAYVVPVEGFEWHYVAGVLTIAVLSTLALQAADVYQLDFEIAYAIGISAQ